MAKKQTSLHINGKRYDALTGNLLEHPIVPRHHAARSIDGLSTGRHVMADAVATRTTAVRAVPLPASQVPRAKAAHAVVHRTKPSATLMRKAVTKPSAPTIKRRAKAQAPVSHHAPVVHQTPSLAVKQSVHAVNHRRQARAQTVGLSPRVARFAHELRIEVPKLAREFEVALEAEPSTAYQPSIVTVTADTPVSDIFEKALLRATTHEQVAPIMSKSKRGRSLRRRMFAFGAGALAVVAIVGFLSYNSVGARFQRQTRGAGFSAVLPAYTPQGFARGSVQTADGLVSTQYVRRDGGLNGATSFAVTQKSTGWDSQTLLGRLVDGSSNITYSSIKTPTTTVYIYGRNQAAWIHNGILYQVLGNGLLSTNDFTKLADSL